MKKIKKWNWSFFVVIICIAEIGALTNKSCESISSAILFGLIMGILIGLPMAILTKNDNT